MPRHLKWAPLITYYKQAIFYQDSLSPTCVLNSSLVKCSTTIPDNLPQNLTVLQYIGTYISGLQNMASSAQRSHS